MDNRRIQKLEKAINDKGDRSVKVILVGDDYAPTKEELRDNRLLVVKCEGGTTEEVQNWAK